MNKYQEAWKCAVTVQANEQCTNVGNKIDFRDKYNQTFSEVLKELVDKITPMKPNNFDKEYCMYNCPNCSKVNATFKFSYCPHCGQKLDWSDK